MGTAHRLFFTVVLLCSMPHAHALNIIWEPLGASTHPGDPAGTFNQELPTDSDFFPGVLLNTLEEVKREFEAAFDDAATIRITYWWDANMTSGGQSDPAWIVESNGAVTYATVRFNSTRNFYYDPTPENDSEFAMSQVLYNYGAEFPVVPESTTAFYWQYT